MAKKITQDEKLDFNIEEVQYEEGPVTCLGKTFANDEERRQYFRGELRKKLPELRHIEGFPIGEDDDIIALSDPPYYTACPNPWLNNFIHEWEEEKRQLVAEGKRVEDKEVKEPYASDVSEGKNNPIYMVQSYHTKCPHTAIMKYIHHYSEPGDIILDGFGGTGMTGVAANMEGRHSICSDLSPLASHIAATYVCNYSYPQFKKKALSIIDLAEKKYGWMYKTQVAQKDVNVNYYIWSETFVCPECGEVINLWKESVANNGEIISSEFQCPNCGIKCTKDSLERNIDTTYDSLLQQTTKQSKFDIVRVNYATKSGRGEQDATHFDSDIYSRCLNEECKYINTQRMPEGSEARRNDTRGFTHIHHFFSYRNLVIINYLIELIGNDTYLLSLISACMLNISKMWKFKPDRKGGSLTGTLYIPSLYIEQNPFNVLRRKINAFEAVVYSGRGNGIISTNSATSINIENDTIDYMFIDPPFGANLMYSQLNFITESLFKVYTDNKEEAIVDIQAQHKDLFDYQQLMNMSLREFYRVLKPGKWLTMEFSNTSASVWNSIQNALQGVGFIVANVAALDKKQGSFKAVTTTTAVKQDLVITCYKPTDELTDKFTTHLDVSIYVWDFIEDLLQHLPIHIENNQKTTAVIERNPKILYDRLISYYVQHGYAIPMNAQEFQQGLRERFVERDGMFFTAEQAIQYEEKRAKTDTVEVMGILIGSEAEGIQWLRNHLRDGAKTYQQLQPEWMQDQVAAKKGDQIPELRDILEENFIKDEEGAWHIPNPEKEADLEQIRNKRLQREFDLYVEQAQKPKAKIKEARLEALRYGFKECYRNKDFQSIVTVATRIPELLLMEDEILLQYYDIAASRV